MDKYEFNIKVEQIKKLVNKGDYETAMKIADTIDWRRVRSTSLLTMVSQVYEKNEEYQDAKDILLLAFERAPIGKGLLYKLTDLALREGNIQEAEAYYREFCDLAGDDPRQNLLRFLILEAKEAPVEQQINSLERYCQDELDEKWMYRLAELYQASGREEDCVRVCDKIMLMFGLGKYVDKAMELKLQYAPLTQYQMDLVENREKYEEKLRAVEEEYRSGVYRREAEEEYFDSEDEEVGDLDASENPDDMEGGETDWPMSEVEEGREARDAAYLEDCDFGGDVADSAEPHREEAVGDFQDGMVLGMPVGGSEIEESAVTEESVAAFEEEEETIVEDWDLEPEEEAGNHLMIEAENPEKGLELALESLKKIHRELGTKNPVAKISGEKLKRRGIFAVADRLAGKDLVVERAADLDAETVGELEQLMERDETGIVVVLIDTPSRLEQMHSAYPGLAGRFQYIGCEKAAEEDADARERELMRIQAEREAEEARRRLAEREEEIRRQAARDAEESRRRQAEEAARRHEEEMRQQEEAYRREEEARQREEAYRREEEARQQEETYRREEERRRAEREAEESRRRAEYEAEHAARRQAELEADEAKRQAEYEEEMRRRGGHKTENRGDEYADAPEEAEGYGDDRDGENRQPSGDMDVEEFVQYACRYASEIDCSISGKSMLALYERAEMMEEDGIPLNAVNAEDLIEEAADKAEKKSFGGLFASKYDKDGLLILKEKHFFD